MVCRPSRIQLLKDDLVYVTSDRPLRFVPALFNLTFVFIQIWVILVAFEAEVQLLMKKSILSKGIIQEIITAR